MAEIRIRGESGRFDNVALHDATATQIREATALLCIARGKDGDLAVSFHAIPIDALDSFVALVLDHLRQSK